MEEKRITSYQKWGEVLAVELDQPQFVHEAGAAMAQLARELKAAILENRELRTAAEIGAKNMKLWVQEGCGCGGDGHVCGILRVKRELGTVEKALAERRVVPVPHEDRQHLLERCYLELYVSMIDSEEHKREDCLKAARAIARRIAKIDESK